MNKNNGDHYRLTPRSVQPCDPAEVFFFRFEPGGGWAYLFIHEQSGTIAIQSDWGEWSYSWSKSGRAGKPMPHWFKELSPEYMAGKFLGIKTQEYDEDRTAITLRKIVKDHIADKDDADEMIGWIDDNVSGTPPEVLWERMPRPLSQHVDPTSDFEHSPTATYRWLTEGILPAMQKALRERSATEAV